MFTKNDIFGLGLFAMSCLFFFILPSILSFALNLIFFAVTCTVVKDIAKRHKTNKAIKSNKVNYIRPQI